MTVEREYKVGDRICTFRNQKGVVVKLNNPFHSDLNMVFVKWDDGKETGIAESQVWHEGATPKFDHTAHQAKLEHEEKLRREEEQRKIERAFDVELKTYPSKMKYHVGDRVRWEQYGCGTVIKASSSLLTVRFANDYERAVTTYPPLRFATEEDEQYDACAVLWAPEPLDETATLDDLKNQVAHWAQIVPFLDGGDDQTYTEYLLHTRECLHGTLNGLKKQNIAIPQNLLQTLEYTDQYFIENTVKDNPQNIDQATYVEMLKKRSPCTGPVTVYDSKLFWYLGRWPKVK